MSQITNTKSANSQKNPTLECIAELISEASEDEGRNYFFASFPKNDDGYTFFSTNTENYLDFWTEMFGIIKSVKEGVPEDKLDVFREGFLPLVAALVQNCFQNTSVEDVENAVRLTTWNDGRDKTI